MMKLRWFALIALIVACQPSSVTILVDGTGTVSGKVVDGSNGSGIAGATVYIQGYQSTVSTTSDGSGNYTLANVPATTVTAVGEMTGYSSDTKSVAVTKNATVSNVNLTLMSNAFVADKYVIVLTWGADPNDLDSHMWVPKPAPAYEIDYNHVGDADGTLDSEPFAALDVDDTNGYGPETVSIKKTGNAAYYNGTYKYFVRRYAGTSPLAGSGAIVKIYDGTTLLKTYTAPAAGAGDYWYVFDLNGSTFTDVNTIQAGAPASP